LEHATTPPAPHATTSRFVIALTCAVAGLSEPHPASEEHPMPRRIIDISVALQSDIASDPPGHEPAITYIDHKMSAPAVCQFFPGLTPDQLPDCEGWALERCDISTHSGTHLDAPWHFATTMDGGKRALSIEEIPLEWCLQPAVKLDFRHFADGYVATPDDVEAELERIGHTLHPLEIVVVNTAAGEHYGQSDYVPTGCGMGREATLFLTRQGVRITGTDAWSWDAPFVHTARRYGSTHDASLIWEGHKAGREIGYCHMEKLANLDKLPSTGFTVCCFPVKITRASAGWTRAVAILED
jgi:kynurenine formamidase